MRTVAGRNSAKREGKDAVLREFFVRFETESANGPEAVFWIDVHSGIIMHCNKNAERLLAIPGEEVIGLHITVIHPRDRNTLYRGLYAGLFSRGVIDMAGEVEAATDMLHPVHINGSCVPIDGAVIGQIVMREIAERKWAEEKLQFLSIQLESIVENIGNGITMSDRDGFFLIYNQRMTDLTGYGWDEANSFEDFIGHISFDRGEYERLRGGVEKAVRTGGINHSEITVLRKDGTRRVLSVVTTCMRIRDRDWLLNAYHDITDRKWMEQALRDSQMRLTVAADAGSLAFCEWIIDDHSLIVNDQWNSITGMEPPQSGVTPDWIVARIHPEDAEGFRKTMIEYYRGRLDHSTGEYRIRHPHKKWIWVYLAARVIEKGPDGIPKRVVGFIQDISGRKKNEEDLEKYRNRLEDLIGERTEELLSLNEYLRAEIAERERAEKEIIRLNRHMLDMLEKERQRVAKDLHDSVGQTILAAKLNFSGSLNGPVVDEERFRAGMEYIDRASQELREVYSNLYPSLLGELGLTAAIRWHVRKQLEMNGITAEIEIEEGIAIPHETAVNLYRITQEIFSNILRHSHASLVKVRLSGGGGCVAMEVEDNGTGFTPDARGDGFGLVNMKQRVMIMGGAVEIDSRIGEGTRISVSVPCEE